MNGITLITPTGGREKSLQRCVKYVSRFTRPIGIPIQWIIVNDCTRLFDAETQDLLAQAWNEIEITVVRPQHVWASGKNTQAPNLLAACDRVKYDTIFFIEDDDWYGPDYLMSMYESLIDVDLVGEIPSRYYYVPNRLYRTMQGVSHASLCQTAMKASLLESFKQICLHHVDYLDWNLWRLPCVKSAVTTKNCVGMKGLPGRPGIGMGHKPNDAPHIWKQDPDLTVLRQWIGDDVKLYV